MPKLDLTSLLLREAPPLDPAWLTHEETAGLRDPKAVLTPEERQPIYAAQCRALNASMIAPGARDHDLSSGISVSSLSVPSRSDGFEIPVLKYEREEGQEAPGTGAGAPLSGDTDDIGKTSVVLIYYHGGGLLVGEADSEELSIRRLLLKAVPAPTVVYSVGYRLMPQVPAQTCVSDAFDAFLALRARYSEVGGARIVVVGSSSGGELAALVSQMAPSGSIGGVLLRCPVTADPDLLSQCLREWHTSSSASFVTTLLGQFRRDIPRDGLGRMPLECPGEELRGLPRTWVQLCTNDVLYSDGLCYAKALQDVGVDVTIDVVHGWPHTFWLKAPHLDRAMEAEKAMLRGLAWILGG
ncbi:Alpha/Beta hydrolase protein [Xylariales sp. PMI_506]|nr:Alpha/Beta hydrolase protein [Xylariales sp. PMI_506]